MKNSIIIFIAIIFSFSSYAQSGQLKKAEKNGKDRNNLFEAIFKKPVKEKNINAWCKENNFVLVSLYEGEFARFGGYEKGIVGARFMTTRDYNNYMEQRRLAAQRQAKYNKERNARNLALGTALVATVGYALFKGGQWVVRNMNTSSYNSSGSTGYSDTKEPSNKAKNTVRNSSSEVQNSPCFEYFGERSYGTTVYREGGGGSVTIPAYEFKCEGDIYGRRAFYVLQGNLVSPSIFGNKKNCVISDGDFISGVKPTDSKEKIIKKICGCSN